MGIEKPPNHRDPGYTTVKSFSDLSEVNLCLVFCALVVSRQPYQIARMTKKFANLHGESIKTPALPL